MYQQSLVNSKPDASEETEEQKEKKHKTFVEKYEKEIKHFGENHNPMSLFLFCYFLGVGWVSMSFSFPGMLRRWDDSQKYLSDNSDLVCEETANYLVIRCIDLEVEEVRTTLYNTP